MSPEEQECALDELQALLKKQIEAAQAGNLTSVELLSRQADSLVSKIARSGVLERSEVKSRREQLQKLYGNLCLALTGQKKDVSEKLIRIRRGKKTIQVYHSNISF
jgi:ribosomal protein S20